MPIKRIIGTIGSSAVSYTYSEPTTNQVEMSVTRPTNDHVARDLGTVVDGRPQGEWVLPGVLDFNDQGLTNDEVEAIYVDAIQKHLDTSAQSYKYDDIKSAVTYADEPAITKYQDEGKAFRQWRSKVWSYMTNLLELYVADPVANPMPTMDYVLANMPALNIVYS